MSCKFCPLGCPISEDNKCCFECDKQQECIRNDGDCKGMPDTFKNCDYYRDKL